MRALHFVTHAFPMEDGYSVRTRYLVRNQQRLGFDPAVVTRPSFSSRCAERLPFRENRDGIDTFHFEDSQYPLASLVGRSPRSRRYAEHAMTIPYYRRVMHQCRPCSVLHVHMQPDQLRYLVPLSRWYGVPLLYEVRGVWEDTEVACGRLSEDSPAYRKRREASTRAARRADVLVTISEGLRRDFIERGVPGDRIAVVPNGVDTSLFLPRPRDPALEQKLGLAGKTVLGYVSSLRRLEGLEHLVNAMPDIVAAVPDSVCLIVGDGEAAPELIDLVKRKGLEDRIIMPGRVPHAEVMSYYSLLDVFVVPRTNARVNNLVTPLKPLEAMSMSKALLVSGVGGLRELVEDGRTGLVFSPDNASDLAEKAIRTLRDGELRRRLGEAARDFVVRERDWTNVIDGFQQQAMGMALQRR